MKGKSNHVLHGATSQQYICLQLNDRRDQLRINYFNQYGETKRLFNDLVDI